MDLGLMEITFLTKSLKSLSLAFTPGIKTSSLDQLNVSRLVENLRNHFTIVRLFRTRLLELFSELKTQNTPFFTAQKNFGIDPTYAVVFNLKDMERYAFQYPEIEIVYWVNWIPTRIEFENGREITCKSLSGIWSIPFQKLKEIIDTSPLHDYYQRTNDNRGNAKSSFVLDIRDSRFERLK